LKRKNNLFFVVIINIIIAVQWEKNKRFIAQRKRKERKRYRNTSEKQTNKEI